MKNLARQFLSSTDIEKITNAVKNAEKETAGEIVPMVVSSSYHYPTANLIGGLALAFPLALLLTPLIGGYFWIGPRDMWLFIGIFILLFAAGHEIVKRTAPLKRLFISKKEIQEEVEEAATTAFFKEGLYRTRDETGILIFISVFERKVWVLADRGINEKVEKNQWEKTVATIVAGIKNNTQGDAICEAVGEIGGLLAVHFPVKPDDTNELKDIIIKD
jgi:putative membrane protein